MSSMNVMTRSYLTETINFVRRVCYKNENTITLQNNYLQGMGYAIPDNEVDYKYYQNLAGNYYDTDEMVYVISSDTGERIPFERSILADHPLTQQDYSPGGSMHEEFLKANPEHRGWLDRVLDPVDPEAAVAAENFQILTYDASLVAENEVSLIYRLQEWLYGWNSRWNNASLMYQEELYGAAHAAKTRNAMVTALLNIRMSAIRTPEVDQYHLWAYLGSHYRLDRYRDYLTTEQALWLYRNMDYLRYHIGKEFVFEMLLEHIAAPSNITASRFDLMYFFRSYLETGKLTPNVLVNDYGDDTLSYRVDARETPAQALARTRYTTERNQDDYEADTATVESEIRSLKTRMVTTGQVQLNLNRTRDELTFNSIYSRVSQWLYLVSKDKMKVAHDVRTVTMGNVSITTEEAALIFVYCAGRVVGETYEIPPPLSFWSILPLQKVDVSVIDHVASEVMTEKNVKAAMYETFPTTPEIFSEEAFDTYIESFRKYVRKQNIFIDSVFESYHKSEAKLIQRLMLPPTRVRLSLGDVDNYSAWLDLNGFDTLKDLSAEDAVETMLSILRDVVAVELTGEGLSAKHKAIMEVIKIFTPYSTTFTADGDLPYPFPRTYGTLTPRGLKSDAKATSTIRMGSAGRDVMSDAHSAYDKPVSQSRTVSVNVPTTPAEITLPQYNVSTVNRVNYQHRGGGYGRRVETTYTEG